MYEDSTKRRIVGRVSLNRPASYELHLCWSNFSRIHLSASSGLLTSAFGVKNLVRHRSHMAIHGVLNMYLRMTRRRSITEEV